MMLLMVWVPLVAVLDVQPPVALQLVALVELHVMVVEAPLAMLDGDAEIDTVGVEAGVTVTVAAPLPEPPVPVHVIA